MNTPLLNHLESDIHNVNSRSGLGEKKKKVCSFAEN